MRVKIGYHPKQSEIFEYAKQRNDVGKNAVRAIQTLHAGTSEIKTKWLCLGEIFVLT